MILSDIQDGDLDVVLSLPLHQKNLYFSKLIKKHYPNVKQSDPRHKELLEKSEIYKSFYEKQIQK